MNQGTQRNKKCPVFRKNFNFRNSNKKIERLKSLSIQEEIIIGTFLLNLTQFEKTELLESSSTSLGNLKIKFHFRN